MTDQLKQLNHLALLAYRQRPAGEIHCGSYTFLRDWIERHHTMRPADPKDLPTYTFAGLPIKENPLLPRNWVYVVSGTEQTLIKLDE